MKKIAILGALLTLVLVSMQATALKPTDIQIGEKYTVVADFFGWQDKDNFLECIKMYGEDREAYNKMMMAGLLDGSIVSIKAGTVVFVTDNSHWWDGCIQVRVQGDPQKWWTGSVLICDEDN